MKTKAARKRQRIKRRLRKKVILASHVGTIPDTEKSSQVPNTVRKPAVTPVTTKSNEAPYAKSNPATEASAMWRGIYESLVFRQCDVQIDYWKQRAKQLERENEELRNQLRATRVPVYETSSEEDCDEAQRRYLYGEVEECDDEDISPEYLEFRSVTLKHREELRKKREKERSENNKSVPPADDKPPPMDPK